MNDLQYYLELPYTVIMRRDEDGDYVARIDELPGCAAHGETQAKALEALEEAKELWITDCLENGDPVPEPEVEDALPSGKWVQRVPRTLHKKLVVLAKRENVSLNQLVTSILAEAVGLRRDDQLRPSRQVDAQLSVWGHMIVLGSHNIFPLSNSECSCIAYTGALAEGSDYKRANIIFRGGWPITGPTSDRNPRIVQPRREEVTSNG